MDWTQRLNKTMDYIESQLDGEIDPGEISRIMASPYSVFQRAFGPVAGVGLAEYTAAEGFPAPGRPARRHDGDRRGG
jgi:hypothetical protein